ncbi:44190_t:CDS:2 [Gigaspora margarita]|uniref:44190_t:CDS:1 n=1 Tax=Gigaspora margarita TaxID=4874 RepID=A0ABN7W568_GIGMA|nr:44190_t:CDS:2 [Gigaspora margarita]
MLFDNFTPIEETNLLSDIKSSNGVNGITIFILSGYSSVLIRNNEDVNSKNMIKELSWLNLKIPAFILNTEIDRYPWLSNHEVSKLTGVLWNMLDPKIKEEYKQQAEIKLLEFRKNNKGKKYNKKERKSNEKTKNVTKRTRTEENSTSSYLNIISKDASKRMRPEENSASSYLDIISKELSNILEIKKNKYEESGDKNNAQEPYSEESNEKNNVQEPYFGESIERNYEESSNIHTLYSEQSSKRNDNQIAYTEKSNEYASFDYQQEFGQLFNSPNNILGLNTSNQLGWESTENLENSSLIYDQSGVKLANSGYSSHMGMPNLSNLDIELLISSIIKGRSQ